MDNIRRTAFIVRTGDDISECLRSALGLAVENFETGLFIIDAVIPADKDKAEFEDRLEMLDDLEGKAFTNIRENTERFHFIRYADLPSMAGLLTGYDLIASF